MVRYLEPFLNPPCLALALMLIAAVWHKRAVLSKSALWCAMAVLLLGGNDWLIRSITVPLEWSIKTPNPMPQADAIVVLGGAVAPKDPPRPFVELGDSGDRVVYAYELFHQKSAPLILCAGGRAEPGVRECSEGEDMRTFLESLGVPSSSILVETNSSNTFENATLSRPILAAKGAHRLLLVTSAMHMPRSLAIFRKALPDFEITPAPTDYQYTEHSQSGQAALESLIPSGERMGKMERILHEYLGMAYYRVRGKI